MVLHTCNVCKTIFPKPVQLKIHVESHSEENTFKEYQINSDKTFQCSHCERSFKQIKYLKSHSLSHSDAKPFTCDVCGGTFKRINEMKRHKVKSCVQLSV